MIVAHIIRIASSTRLGLRLFLLLIFFTRLRNSL